MSKWECGKSIFKVSCELCYLHHQQANLWIVVRIYLCLKVVSEKPQIDGLYEDALQLGELKFANIDKLDFQKGPLRPLLWDFYFCNSNARNI